MTIDREQTETLTAMGKDRKAQVLFAIETMSPDIEELKLDTEKFLPANVQSWLDDRDIHLARSVISKYLNGWKREKEIPVHRSTGKTAEQEAMTPELLAEMDAERDAARINEMEPEDFGPHRSAPVSPAVTSPVVVTSREASEATGTPWPQMASRNADEIHDAMMDADREMTRRYAAMTPPRQTGVMPAASPAVTPRDVPEQSAPSKAPAESDYRAALLRDAKRKRTDDDTALPEIKPPFSFRVLYGLLLLGAAYGLYNVFDKVADAPWFIAAVSAAGIELLAIAIKRAADKSESWGEQRRWVRAALITSAVLAFAIAGVNGWGHFQIDMDGNGEWFAAIGFALCSAGGYLLWTYMTFVTHRATQRLRGRLEGPGVRIPKYIEDRHGPAVAERAERLSQFNEALTIEEAVTLAIAEIDAAERDERERGRLQALRDGLEAEALERHNGNKLAASLDAAQYSADVLADLMTADAAGHAAKRDDLRDWVASYKTK